MKRLFFASLFYGILLVPTLMAVENPEVPAKAKRIVANEGTLIYDLPKNAEITLRWKQFNGNDQETHCTAVLPDKKEWTNLHLVDSRGEGQWGPGGFSCLRLAKTPPEEVRVSFRNLGDDTVITLRAQNSTGTSVPIWDGEGKLPTAFQPLRAGHPFLTASIDAQKQQLTLTFPSSSPKVLALKSEVSSPGCLIYDLPQDQEITLKWPQFHAGSSEIQYEVASADWQVFGPDWGASKSHGEGIQGKGIFAAVRASKTPHAEVRCAIKNTGEDGVFHLMRTSGTNEDLPISDSLGNPIGFRRKIQGPEILFSHYLLGEQERLIILYPRPLETDPSRTQELWKSCQTKGEIRRISPVPGCLVYDLPKDQEITIQWRQFPLGAAQEDRLSVQYGVSVNKGAVWTGDHLLSKETDGEIWGPQWGSTESHGDGEKGKGAFSSFRASKIPFGNVCASVTNRGTDVVYHLISYTNTVAPFPISDSVGEISAPIRKISEGQTLMSFHLFASENRLVIIYPSTEKTKIQ